VYAIWEECEKATYPCRAFEKAAASLIRPNRNQFGKLTERYLPYRHSFLDVRVTLRGGSRSLVVKLELSDEIFDWR
jgi:hypothetical protein